ncbi:MAG: DUF2924 domain-containing protein [Hyphomonadaceae bacterium]
MSAARPIDDLQSFSLEQLRAAWSTEFACAPPAYRSRDLLFRALLYRRECQRFGGPSGKLKKRLTDLETRFAKDASFDPAPRARPSIGSALVREWNGVRHVVLVTPEGYQYLDHTYASLTEVAKVISGTHWSGPRFFGLIGARASRKATQ